MFTVLIVEDDRNLNRMMSVYLSHHGFHTISALDGEEALNILESNMPDLTICDVMMPRMDGYQLTQDLRSAYPEMPVLIVTAKDSIDDKRTGFLAGADDYMVKPIDLDELKMRVAALLRRSRIATERIIRLGDTEICYDSLTVSRHQIKLQLTKKEFLLLFKLLSYPDRIFTRRQLMDDIWGMDAQSDERTVDVHVKRLREKCVGFPEFRIVTIRGLGYKAEKSS